MKKIYLIAMLALIWEACQQKENLSPNSVIKDKVKAQTEIDTYIYQNFQQPYNIIPPHSEQSKTLARNRQKSVDRCLCQRSRN